MKKIPSLFVRDFENDPKLVLPLLTPGCEWVLAGEGTPTRKRDGTACLIDDFGWLWRRYEAKHGKTPPEGFSPAQPAPDPKTGHWPGWLMVRQSAPQDKWYFAATWPTGPGTYELCGPKFQSNAEGLAAHVFFRHGGEVLQLQPRVHEGDIVEVYTSLRFVMARFEMGGIVWQHPDGRMAKLKRSDFGFAWPVR